MSLEPINSLADSLAHGAASLTTRRRFLRRLGAAGLGLSLAGVMGGIRPRPAFAHGTRHHPCGPSPLCHSNQCSSGLCNHNNGCKNRKYATFRCTSSTAMCWGEDYRSQGGGWYQCCDCCCKTAKGDRCHGSKCGYPKYACICRSRVG
jgi:hypothetical protein